ncbi:MAG: hypothetical protein KME17_25195 [Cyanosarcina radialis HA8281-LM2]|nr:hypothetical protein [Cyanosarcina radialis HA8281-LM2]
MRLKIGFVGFPAVNSTYSYCTAMITRLGWTIAPIQAERSRWDCNG